tara:strand:- start:1308 stop:1604 length:297 start_codon:yes stop_codon:yes gene_type:complete
MDIGEKTVKLNRKHIRKLILQEMAVRPTDGGKKVVELSFSEANNEYILQDNYSEYRMRVVLNERDALAGALATLKEYGYTHVKMMSSIDDAINIFNDE